MAVYLEFVVLGPPISNQQSTPAGRANLLTWRARIDAAASAQWPNPPNPLVMVDLKTIIINFYAGNSPSLDTDNLSKPILDVMQSIVYANDRQIVQAEIAHVRIGAAFSIMGIRPIIATALQAGDPFVYVRIEDPVDPFPLPK